MQKIHLHFWNANPNSHVSELWRRSLKTKLSSWWNLKSCSFLPFCIKYNIWSKFFGIASDCTMISIPMLVTYQTYLKSTHDLYLRWNCKEWKLTCFPTTFEFRTERKDQKYNKKYKLRKKTYIGGFSSHSLTII